MNLKVKGGSEAPSTTACLPPADEGRDWGRVREIRRVGGMEGGDKEGERVDTGIRECYRRDEA